MRKLILFQATLILFICFILGWIIGKALAVNEIPEPIVLLLAFPIGAIIAWSILSFFPEK